MILCSLEPGLLSLSGLSSGDLYVAQQVVLALISHRGGVRLTNAKIPLTDTLLERIVQDLHQEEPAVPPLHRPFRELVLELLSRHVVPSPVPTGLGGTTVTPTISSPWTDPGLLDLWMDSLIASIFDLLAPSDTDDTQPTFCVATWNRDGLPKIMTVTNETLAEIADGLATSWQFPVLGTSDDWIPLQAKEVQWPDNIHLLVRAYVLQAAELSSKVNKPLRRYGFTPACLAQIASEADPAVRDLVVETLACLALDHRTPKHENEKVRSQHGLRRVHVKKTKPPIRLHYRVIEGELQYVMYSNSDHDAGLKRN